MKNNLFKKSMSVFLSVLMIMSCWVFVPGEHNHAEAAGADSATSSTNQEAISSFSDSSFNVPNPTTITGKFHGDTSGSSDYVTTTNFNNQYKKILYSPAYESSDNALNSGWAANFTGISNIDSVRLWYPTTTMIYDGSGINPKMGVLFAVDAASKKQVGVSNVYMSANANGLVMPEAYWHAKTTASKSPYYSAFAHLYLMYNVGASWISTSSGNDKTSTTSKGAWEVNASTIEYQGGGFGSGNTYYKAITPTWTVRSGSNYSVTAQNTIYVIDYVPYKNAMTKMKEHYNAIKSEPGKYSTASVAEFKNVANKLIGVKVSDYINASKNDVSGWNTAVSSALTAYNSFKLQEKNVEITYDNIFSLADWRYSKSLGDANYVSVNLDEGKVTIKNPNTSEFTTPMSGSSSNANTRNTSFYAMPVVGGKEYTFKYTTDGTNTEMFAFFYDANGGCAHESSYGAYCFTVSNGTGEKTFKAPDGAAYMEIRFDNNVNGTANYWDIMIYPAAVKTENEVDSWTNRPHRQIYAYNASVGTLQTPVRPGYIFGGWKEDTDGDGVGDAAAPTGTITSSRVLYSTWTPSTMDVGYDNLFSVSEWGKAALGAKTNQGGTITVDADNGTIAIENPANKDFDNNYTPWTYAVPVDAGKEYIFVYDTDIVGATGTQIHIFYKKSAEATGYTGFPNSPYVRTEGHRENNTIIFTPAAGTTHLSFRFGTTDGAGMTNTFSNIGLYEKADYDAYAKDYEKVREPFIIGDTTSLMNPTREGYVFTGWEREDGTKITSVAGLKANTTVYATWTKEYTVTYYYGDNTTVLATVTVKDGETVDALPTVTPTKETTAEYSYSFKNWTANGTAFTASTKVTSDLKVYPVFENVPHTFVWAANPYKNATCDAPALVGKSCSGCGYSLGNVPYDGDNENWLAKGHDYSRGEILENSSTGNTDTDTHSIKCARYSTCGSVQKVSHTWTGDTSVGATCTTPGTVKKTCPCGAEKFVEGAIDSTNHVNTKLVNVVTPDCEKDGFTGDLVCADCGVTIAFGKTDPKLGHLFTKYLSDGNATCTADGTETAHCERCAETDTRTVEGSKLDHTFTNYVYNNDAKCGVDGTKTAECDTCDTNATDTITAEGTALTHNFNGEIKNNNDGTHSYKCTNKDCDVYGGTVDCTYGEWDTTDSSQHIKTCKDCGYKLKENHKFSAWATTDEFKQADGQHSRTCLVCHKEVIKDCTYTRTEHAESCTEDGYIVHSCNDCGHKYQTVATGKIGHNYSGEVQSFSNGQHNYLCVNGCGTYGYSGVENARVNCSFDYENTADGSHKATCAFCNYSTTEACSGGQATCTAKAECTKCNTVYGETVPHSFKGAVVKLDGDKHAYLCEFCGTTTGIKGVGSTVDATENCSGGTATCKDLAVCENCNDTYGDYAAHVFNGFVIQLDNDVHAFRCSVCKDNSLYGVGSEVNATEACSGGTATCIRPALCEVCSGYHGEVDENAHVWRDWAHVEGTETHKRVCDLNPGEHIEIVACQAATQKVVEPDCEAQGYTLNTCGTCGHEWKSDYVDALDHQWGAWEQGSAGWHQRTCEREGCTYGENGTAKVEESLCMYLQEVKEVVEPTCTEEGYTTYRCTGCGYEWNSFPVPATGHSYTEKKKKTDSKYQRSTKDCVTDWTYWYCCDNCDVSAETEKDLYANEADLYWTHEPAAGHKFDAKIATEDYNATKATCTAKATYYYSCSVCKASSKGTANEKTFEHGSALNHDWTDTETYKKSNADCINNEVYYKECSRCKISSEKETGATWEKADTKSGHDFKDGYTKGVAATCTEDGVVEHYTCNVCKKHFKADKTTEIAADKLTIDALKHDFKDVAAKPATCEEAGYTKHKQCQREGCGYRNTDYKVIDALGHEFKAENGYYTDTAIGYHAYKCSNCEAYGVDKVKYSAEYDGLDWIVVGGIKCEFTGEYVNYDDANGIHSHKLICVCGNEQSAACADANPERVAPTCTKDGYYVHVCDVCSFKWIVESDAEADKALGHKLVVVPNNNGTHSAKCERENCDYAEAAEKCSTATPATNCGDYDICDICKTAFGEAKPHVFTNYVYNNDAKCGVNGTETAVCDTCKGEEKATDTRTAENTALQHVMVVFEDADSLEYKTAGVWQYNNAYGYDLSKWLGMPAGFDAESIDRPTCSKDGLAISYCTRKGCDHYITMVAARVDDGHEWGEEKSIGGNCATGVTFRKECVNCGAATTRVETVDHTYVLRALENANCTTEEIRYYVCSVCGDENEEHIGEKLGHDWAKEVIEKEATCGQTGRKYSICSRCNAASEKTEIPRTGHVWEQEGFDYAEYLEQYPNANILYVEAVEATCEFEGHNGYYKCFSCSYDQHLDEEWRKDNIIAKKGHEDNNGDSKCDECNDKIYGEDKDSACGCICHKENWFSKLIYKILCFFWKLFGIGKSCDCGTVHY